MWAVVLKIGGDLLSNTTVRRCLIAMAVSWLCTAYGCSYTSSLSVAWAKRQAYKQGYREGKETCEADESQGERRRWRLFSSEADEVPWLGIWYGATDDYCVDGETIEVEPTEAER